jgi:hypothetical protein
MCTLIATTHSIFNEESRVKSFAIHCIKPQPKRNILKENIFYFKNCISEEFDSCACVRGIVASVTHAGLQKASTVACCCLLTFNPR